jgi:RNA polymerase sigma factor (sigma-70 family)
MTDPRETEMGGAAHRFPETSWSILGRLRGENSDERRQALQRLIHRYWKPVYCVIRRSWGKTNEEAKDLTQDFFASVVMEGPLLERYAPDRGSFHVYLKAAITNFMRDAVKTENRRKRGGDARILSLDFAADAEELVPADAATLPPDQVFDLAWKNVVFAQALEQVEKKLLAEGKAATFEVFKRYDLQQENLSYKQLGEQMGLSETTVQNYLTRAREELRRAVIEVVSDYVDSKQDLAKEIRWLFQA